jgi:nucleoside-diphosphate-sugar epimerase
MLTAIPDPVDPRHLARDMALTNRLRTQGTANLLAAAGGARVIVQGVAYAYDPAGPPVKDEDAPLWHHPPTQFAPGGRRRGGAGPPCHLGRGAGAAAGPPLRAGLWLRPRRRRPHPAAPRRQAPADRRRASLFSFIHAHDVATAILAAATSRPGWPAWSSAAGAWPT